MIKKSVIVWICLMVVALLVMTFGVHYQTTINGTHTGIITAVEENGIIFKTASVYVKTDAMSSQEDKYCLIDKSLIPQLQQYEQSKQNVTIVFNGYLLPGYKYCNGESAIITGLK